MTARALDEAVAGRIALCTTAVETRAERASELELLEALNLFLSQCLSAKAENAMVRNNQLPEWQQKSLLRLRILVQLIVCQTRKNWTGNGDP